MLQIVETKLIVQRDNVTKDKYYPKVLSATTSYEYPFAIPTATIEIITNVDESTGGYISPVRVDDIIQLLVSTKMNINEKTVWERIFEGRVRDITSRFESSNTSTLFCIGHIGEAGFALCDLDLSYNNRDVGYIVTDICFHTPPLLFRVAWDASFIESAPEIEYFNLQANQRYIADAFSDLEKLAKYHYYFSIVCTYDANNNLVAPYLRWRHFPEKMTNKYAVIEGTERLLSAEFKSSAEELWNYVRVCGETAENADSGTGDVSGTQVTGAATSSISRAKYGLHGKVLSIAGIETNYMCANLAAAMVVRFRNPIVSGSATILGTPAARLGDLVHVKIPSLEINGAYVDRNYHVYKVEHSISGSSFITSLDFTKVKKTPEDYIADFAKQSRVSSQNDVVTDESSYSNQDGSEEYNITSDTSDEGDSGYTDTSTYEDNTDYSENY